MAKTKKQQIGKSGDELKVAVKELRAEIAKLAMEHAKRQLKQTTKLRTKRDELARMLTTLNMVKLTDKNKGAAVKASEEETK